MQSAFIQALTYSPPVILGRRLLPFSSWHGLILEAAGSPYIAGGVPDLDDLTTAIWICSHPFEDGLANIHTAHELRKWGRSIKRLNFTDALAVFREYISASLASPEFWTDKENHSLRAPFFWHCVTFCMRDLHMTETQAWNYPVTRIICLQACVGERDGSTNLKSPDEIEGMNALKAEAAQESAAKENI